MLYTFLIYLMFLFGITFSLVAVYFEKRRKEKVQSFHLEQTLKFGRVCTGQYIYIYIYIYIYSIRCDSLW